MSMRWVQAFYVSSRSGLMGLMQVQVPILSPRPSTHSIGPSPSRSWARARGIDDVKNASAEWVHWFNPYRSYGSLGGATPAPGTCRSMQKMARSRLTHNRRIRSPVARGQQEVEERVVPLEVGGVGLL